MMATDAPTNGYSHVNPYATNEQNFGSHQVNNSASSGYASTATPSANASQTNSVDISKEEVAWYFVEQYYTTMSRNPEKLYLFFNKRSQFVSGVEEAKVGVCLGQKAILERIKDLEYQDCKVRVTNVDSQSSDANIVIQVIGEMSNKSQPHRKFVQTFILATQTNGYFVLNDIFRYIKDEDEEPEADNVASATGGYLEPSHTTAEPETSTKETISQQDVPTVDKKLEELPKEESAAESTVPATNGTPVPEPEEETPAEEEPAAPIAALEELKIEEPEEPVAEEHVEPEKPKDPTPTPAPAPKASPKPAATPSATPSAPPKPAMPKTWAQLASQNRATAAAAAAANAPAQAAPSTTSPPKPTTQKDTSSAAPAASIPAPPAREPSPADSGKEGSTGGWQTAGAEHSRKASRAQAQPAVGQDGKVRAYVKNVYQTVDADALKNHLAKFGELAYFDISRPKNSAFVEFTNVAGFQAAVAANPHKLGNDSVYVEERRPAGQFNARGGGSARGGRGGFEQRPGGQGQGRGAFGGRGGRGGTASPRGRGGAAQAA